MGFGSNLMPGGYTKLRKASARTQYYFNSPLVINAMDKATHKALMISALRIRKTARRSMRYVTSVQEQGNQIASGKRKRLRPPKPSAPGMPPHAIRPHPWIRANLDAAYDPVSKTAVIGPTPFPMGRMAIVPRLLEKGGLTKRRRNPRRTIRRLGGAGEIRLDGKRSKTTKMTEGRWVTYGKLRTVAQRDRANAINKQLYGPLYIGGKPLAPRPYMVPALALETPHLVRGFHNSLWANSVQ